MEEVRSQFENSSAYRMVISLKFGAVEILKISERLKNSRPPTFSGTYRKVCNRRRAFYSSRASIFCKENLDLDLTEFLFNKCEYA